MASNRQREILRILTEAYGVADWEYQGGTQRRYVSPSAGIVVSRRYADTLYSLYGRRGLTRLPTTETPPQPETPEIPETPEEYRETLRKRIEAQRGQPIPRVPAQRPPRQPKRIAGEITPSRQKIMQLGEVYKNWRQAIFQANPLGEQEMVAFIRSLPNSMIVNIVAYGLLGRYPKDADEYQMRYKTVQGNARAYLVRVEDGIIRASGMYARIDYYIVRYRSVNRRGAQG